MSCPHRPQGDLFHLVTFFSSDRCDTLTCPQSNPIENFGSTSSFWALPLRGECYFHTNTAAKYMRFTRLLFIRAHMNFNSVHEAWQSGEVFGFDLHHNTTLLSVDPDLSFEFPCSDTSHGFYNVMNLWLSLSYHRAQLENHIADFCTIMYLQDKIMHKRVAHSGGTWKGAYDL